MKNRLHASTVVITVLITSAMLASVCTGRAVTGNTDITGMDMFDDRRLNMIDPRMGMGIDKCMDAGIGSTYSEQFEMGSTSLDIPFTHGITAGDLNGDGNDDVLIFNGTHNSSGYIGTYAYDYVSAVNGLDGTELWRYDLESTTSEVTVSDAPAHPLGDLNGDGTDDVLVIVSSQNSDTGKTTATVSAIRGENGAGLWSRTITGDTGYGFGNGTYISNLAQCDLNNDGKNDVLLTISIYDSSAGKTTTTVHAKHGDSGDDFWNQSTAGTGILMWACSGCDLDGDDQDDVIVNLRSLDITTVETTAAVHAKRGYDGHEFWSQSETGKGVLALSYSAGDFDGDDKDDVVAMFQTRDFEAENFSTTVYLKRGHDGHEFWSQSAAGKNVYTPLLAYPGCDLDGDNQCDVVIVSRTTTSDSGNELTATVHAKRGYDGHEFWSQSETGESLRMFAYPYCDLDGNGKSDVTVGLVRDSGTDETNATVHAKHGETGANFWSQSITGKDALLGVYTHCDLNGDDKSDAIAISEVTNPVTDETTITVHAKRGDTGVDFWNQEATGVNITLSAYSYCDFNSDGKDDVIVESKDCDSDDEENTATISVKNGETGTELWIRTVTGEGVWIDNDYCNYYMSDQDFDGDDLEDLLITTGTSVDVMYVGSTEIPTSVCAVKGNSGTPLWCEPSASSEPEPPATGDLNGDDAITPADAVIALNIIASGNYNEDVDVNGDGVTNSLDALMILQAAVGAITL